MIVLANRRVDMTNHFNGQRSYGERSLAVYHCQAYNYPMTLENEASILKEPQRHVTGTAADEKSDQRSICRASSPVSSMIVATFFTPNALKMTETLCEGCT